MREALFIILIFIDLFSSLMFFIFFLDLFDLCLFFVFPRCSTSFVLSCSSIYVFFSFSFVLPFSSFLSFLSIFSVLFFLFSFFLFFLILIYFLLSFLSLLCLDISVISFLGLSCFIYLLSFLIHNVVKDRALWNF